VEAQDDGRGCSGATTRPTSRTRSWTGRTDFHNRDRLSLSAAGRGPGSGAGLPDL